MPRIRLILSIFLFSTLYCHGQFIINLEAGSSLTALDLRGENRLPNNQLGIGAYLSVTPEYVPVNWLSIKLELQESIERYTYNSFFTIGSLFNYIRIAPIVELRPFGNIGIYSGFNYGIEIIDREIASNVPIPNPTSITVPAEKDDVAIFTGISYRFNDFYISARYMYGLKAIDGVFVPDETGTLFVGEEIRSSFLQIGLGYKFDLSEFLSN